MPWASMGCAFAAKPYMRRSDSLGARFGPRLGGQGRIWISLGCPRPCLRHQARPVASRRERISVPPCKFSEDSQCSLGFNLGAFRDLDGNRRARVCDIVDLIWGVVQGSSRRVLHSHQKSCSQGQTVRGLFTINVCKRLDFADCRR